MRTRLGLISLACIAGAILTAGCESAKPAVVKIPDGPIAWETDYKVATARAKSEKKILMVQFYADWCHYCHKLDEETFLDPEVARMANAMVPVRINGDNEPSIKAQFAVEGYPNTVFMDSKGDVITRIGGYAPPQEFARLMRSVIGQVTPAPEPSEPAKPTIKA